MGPDIKTTNPVNPHMHLAINATTSLNILIVVIMMRMTYTSFMQFYENVDMSMIRGICRHGGRKKVPRR